MNKIKALSLNFIQFCQKRWLAFSHIIAVIITAYIIYRLSYNENVNDLIRNIIFATGGIGGLYGLIIATRRQNRFEEQVTLGQEQHKLDQKQFKIVSQQMFNERLGRGVELLSHSKVLFRLAGIRVLNDLLLSADKSQQKLIIEILTDFLHSMSPLQSTNNKTLGLGTIPRSEKLDIELTVRTLMDHTGEYNKIEFTGWEFSSFNNPLIKISFDRLDLRGLDFSNTKFSNANFSYSNLDGCDFSGSNIINTIFRTSGMGNADQRFQTYENINFSGSKLVNCCFSTSKFINVEFSNYESEKNQRTQIIKTQLRSTAFEKCNLSNVLIDAKHIGNNYISDARFTKCNLHSAEFKSQHFHGVVFKDCNMFNCKFKEIDFYNVDPHLLKKQNKKIIIQNCIHKNEQFSL